MNLIKVPFKGKGYRLSYRVETIDVPVEALQYLNVYTVNVEDEELQKLLGKQFSILHHPLQLTTPAFHLTSAENADERNLKKQISQQILNNPTE